MRGADVVTVPDFQGSTSALFEARSLLFLGSWLENAGAAREWPLHLACIGEPPPRVRALAERCGARISVHAPVARGQAPTRNKLRGFDVKPETDRILLLDVDVLVLGDPSPVLALEPGLAVAPAGSHRIRLDMSERVYAAVGEPLPEERILCVRAELADRLPERAWHGRRHLEPMVPYYNSGVLALPWRDVPGFVETWEDYQDRLARQFPLDDPTHRKISIEDQFGFALTVGRCRRQGLPLVRLPGSLHGTWMHLMAGDVSLADARLYHAVHLLRLGGGGPDWLREVDLYERFVLEHVYPPGLRGRAARAWRRLAGEAPGVREIRALCEHVRVLLRRYVDGAG